MTQPFLTRRYVVCVDGVDSVPGVRDLPNSTNISRLYAVIKTGVLEVEGRAFRQDAKYYQAAFLKRTRNPGKSHEQQIYDIVLDICGQIDNPEDEIFLFGSGIGAHTVLSVAGILHHMGIPKPEHMKDFAKIYNTALHLMTTHENNGDRKSHTELQYLRMTTHGIANVPFVGLLDGTKPSSDQETCNIGIISTVRNFRHAMAFNEVRTTKALDMPETPVQDHLGRSFIQAWFLGEHSDLVGGVQHDGFSIYPLQWLLIEAMLIGLYLSFEPTTGQSGNPLALAFPKHAGHVPDLSRDEKSLWQLRYANNIEVKMYDLQSVHYTAKEEAKAPSHALHFENAHLWHNTPRRIFDKDTGGLIGYRPGQSSGTIVHPSVFCILDRHQHFLKHNRFKFCRKELLNFETYCLRSGSSNMPPWLQESELLASGVKAFRILVCGKTGVGKSTLINKVFGVEITEESGSYAQGQHDINKAFESSNHPGLLIHDSRGWQAGSNKELDLIAGFLRHRAYQNDPAEALHVIWFCVDSDVSRIEEADKRTFETIAQHANTVPVFVVGTKKDKLVAYHKMVLLEEYMKKTNDYQESSRLASVEAGRLAEQQFANLRQEFALLTSYRADGHICISKGDNSDIRSLLTQTVAMITDDRVRLFCVAAQVVDVDKKIDSAITECMRLGTHAIRTALVPLPLSGIVSTPTVSRIICEHVLVCFGFPKAVPAEVDEVMNRVVLGNLKKYLAVSLAQFVVIAAAISGLTLATVGAGAVAFLASPLLNAQPAARMILKCSTEMILILERAFRYNGKYVSVKQIEDAAKQYVSIETTSFEGKRVKLQRLVRDEIDRLVPLRDVAVGFKFNKLRASLEHLIYKNRFDKPPDHDESKTARLAEIDWEPTALVEAPGDTDHRVEVLGDTLAPFELDSTSKPAISELADSEPLIAHQIQAPSELSGDEMETSDASTSRVTTEVLPMTSSLRIATSIVGSDPGNTKRGRLNGRSMLLSRVGKSVKKKICNEGSDTRGR